MLKWRLLLTTLPVVAVVLNTALVLTGGIFLIGFMLAGTLADYKESEKLPAELAAQLETLEDSLEHAIAVNATPIDRSSVMAVHHDMSHGIHQWLLKQRNQEQMFGSLHQVALTLQRLEKEGVHGGAVGKMTGDVDKIRKAVTRLGVISRTGFLATGYAMLEMLIVLIICLMLVSTFKSWADEGHRDDLRVIDLRVHVPARQGHRRSIRIQPGRPGGHVRGHFVPAHRIPGPAGHAAWQRAAY